MIKINGKTVAAHEAQYDHANLLTAEQQELLAGITDGTQGDVHYARGLYETSDPGYLEIGQIQDGYLIRRNGSNIEDTYRAPTNSDYMPLGVIFMAWEPRGDGTPVAVGGSPIAVGGNANDPQDGYHSVKFGDAGSGTSRIYSTLPTVRRGYNLTMEFLFQLGTDISNGIIAFGLQSNTTVVSGATVPASQHDCILHYVPGTDTYFTLTNANGSSQTRKATNVTPTASYFYRATLKLTNGQSELSIGGGATIADAVSAWQSAGSYIETGTLPGASTDLYFLQSLYRSSPGTSKYFRMINTYAIGKF